jgi:hypothetical protein
MPRGMSSSFMKKIRALRIIKKNRSKYYKRRKPIIDKI